MYGLKLRLVYIIVFLFINNYNLCYYSLRKDVNIMKSSWDLSHLYTSEEKWQYDFDKLSMYQEIDRITSEEDLSTYEE